MEYDACYVSGDEGFTVTYDEDEDTFEFLYWDNTDDCSEATTSNVEISSSTCVEIFDGSYGKIAVSGLDEPINEDFVLTVASYNTACDSTDTFTVPVAMHADEMGECIVQGDSNYAMSTTYDQEEGTAVSLIYTGFDNCDGDETSTNNYTDNQDCNDGEEDSTLVNKKWNAWIYDGSVEEEDNSEEEEEEEEDSNTDTDTDDEEGNGSDSASMIQAAMSMICGIFAILIVA
eukprot:CAMPEP_0114592980 /NCGR_PEP_ID=MMETSP0125-20121206/14669_1 /TAXON_ID=485358 ORGANISM="Aristerostoma sp., Strain ATCC 50986" /NCGR_SAMPLE_ID=MMETSP0125 /ASSEMBLY_ACC=CAM_ASM_000245 /LENGTH=230 /DNA_ID=CAMNT_0001791891 /DNA_START=146 /DNA_END=838 /DNA_ORIENTATION=+